MNIGRWETGRARRAVPALAVVVACLGPAALRGTPVAFHADFDDAVLHARPSPAPLR